MAMTVQYAVVAVVVAVCVAVALWAAVKALRDSAPAACRGCRLMDACGNQRDLKTGNDCASRQKCGRKVAHYKK